MRGLIGKKIGMTRVFDENGQIIPVTVLQAGPCTVTQIKTSEKDGYEAVQVGYGDRKDKHTNMPMNGHYKKAGISPKKVLAEFNKIPGFEYKTGQIFHVGLFQEGDYVNVSGISKGKGFSGVIKRHNFSRQKKDPWYWAYGKSARIHRSSIRSIPRISGNADGGTNWE